MNCEQYLDQMADAMTIYDGLMDERQQIDFQLMAQQGIMQGIYLQYLLCMENQEPGPGPLPPPGPMMDQRLMKQEPFEVLNFAQLLERARESAKSRRATDQ
jgi:hypothetical protein